MFQDLLNKKLKKAQKGFTLMELLVSIVFFSIIVWGLSDPLSRSAYLTVDNRHINTANTLARSYLKELQDSWKLRNAFDVGSLGALTSEYTDSGKYSVSVTSENIVINDQNTVLVRRIRIIYRDKDNNILSDISCEYPRPGNVT
jgi:prepilin-type N-terminal cleavage/methylation domain-containing protein